jgi:hypothetical protein
LYIPIISQEISLNFIFFLKPKIYEWEVIFPKTSWGKGQNDDPKYPHLFMWGEETPAPKDINIANEIVPGT